MASEVEDQTNVSVDGIRPGIHQLTEVTARCSRRLSRHCGRCRGGNDPEGGTPRRCGRLRLQRSDLMLAVVIFAHIASTHPVMMTSLRCGGAEL